MELKSKNQLIYDTAVELLSDIRGFPKGDLSAIDEYYFEPKRPNSLNEVLKRFAISAQNSRGFPNIIQFDQREKELLLMFHHFDPHWVAEKMDADGMGNSLRDRYSPNSGKPKNPCQNTWMKWARSIKDSAEFLSKFTDEKEFYCFVERYLDDVESRADLAFLLSRNITGLGFALGCDALKELGFTSFAKPDVHISTIFHELGLLPESISGANYWNKAKDWRDYQVFKRVIEFADSCHEYGDETAPVTPYKVDKVMWLVSTGSFYRKEDAFPNAGSHRSELLKRAKERLALCEEGRARDEWRRV